MIAYFDASSFAMLALQDAGWPRLLDWVERVAPEAMVSDFGWGEFISAVSLRVRQRVATAEEAEVLIRNAGEETASWTHIRVNSDDIEAAIALVRRFDLKLKLPDALHVAVARRVGGLLVSTDHRQAAAAESLNLPVFNPLSGDIAS